MLSTRFTRLLGIRHPVVQAPMGLISRAELAAAVGNAGGLGIMSMVRMSPEFIVEQIRRTRALTPQPFGINLIPTVAPASGIESQFEAVPPFASMPPSVATEGRTDLMANYAGQGVGLIRDILPAATIVEQIVSGAETTIARLAALAPRRS